MTPSGTPAQKQEAVSLIQKFVSGELQYGFWGVIARIVGWGSSFLILTSLTVFQYGVFQLMTSTYAMVAEFMSWGGLAAGTDILRSIARGNEARAKRLFFEYNGLRMGTALFLWSLFFFNADVFAFTGVSNAGTLIRIMSFLFLSDALLAAVKTVVNARLDFRSLSSRRSIGKGLQFAILVGFFIFSQVGLKELILSVVIGNFISVLILLPAAVRAWKPWRTLEMERGPSVLWEVARTNGKWDSIKNIVSQFGSQVPPLLINAFITTEAVGIYAVATALAEMVMQGIPRNTMGTLIARVFRDRDRTQRVFRYALKYLIIWGFMCITGSLIVVPVVIHFVLPQYSSSLQIFSFLVFLVPIKSLQWMTDQFLTVLRQQKFTFMRMIFRNTILITFLFILLPTIGLWALPITEMFIRTSIAYSGYRRLLHIRPEFKLSPRLFFSFEAQDRRILGSALMHAKGFIRRFGV